MTAQWIQTDIYLYWPFNTKEGLGMRIQDVSEVIQVVGATNANK